MTSTLADILQQVEVHAARRARHLPERVLEERARNVTRRPFRRSLEQVPFAVIAEMKRASPSAGELCPDLEPARMAGSYAQGGARALSVLTTAPFFRGSLEDLALARRSVELPVLCKDFLLSSYQVAEAAAYGADAVLLIAAVLDAGRLAELTERARSLGLEVLHEVHARPELERVAALEPTLLGVNSRDLATLEVRPEQALGLGRALPPSALGVFESGVKSPDDLERARQAGFRAALVGEWLVRAEDPAAALRSLLARTPP